jgi:hypothetical protein
LASADARAERERSHVIVGVRFKLREAIAGVRCIRFLSRGSFITAQRI